jgi:hypothetical protein
MNAAKTKDPTERPGLLQFAQLCEILANSIEASLADESASKGSELGQHRKQKAPTEVGASPFVPATWR